MDPAAVPNVRLPAYTFIVVAVFFISVVPAPGSGTGGGVGVAPPPPGHTGGRAPPPWSFTPSWASRGGASPTAELVEGGGEILDHYLCKICLKHFLVPIL